MEFALEERIARLEGANRRLRWGLAVTGFAMLGLATSFVALALSDPRALPDKITAREFEVLDDNGSILMRLGANVGGNAGLAFYDARQNTLARFGIKESGETAVDLFDRAGNNRAGLAVSGDGGRGGLYLRGSTDELHRVALSVSDEGLPLFVLYNKAGKPGALLKVADNGGSGLSLYDSSVAPRVKLAADSDSPELVFKHKDGEEFWKAP